MEIVLYAGKTYKAYRGMGRIAACTIADIGRVAEFIRISSAGLKESHVHDVVVTREAPNYRR